MLFHHRPLLEAIADNVKNTRSFERSVLAGVLNATLAAREKYKGSSCLRGKVSRWPGLSDVSVAAHMNVFSAHLSSGDVVFRGDAAGSIVGCLQQGSTLMVLVETMRLVSVVSAHSARWRALTAREIWLASHVECALAWYVDGLDVVVVRS